MADPLDNTIKAPNTHKVSIIGNNQNFLRSFKNPHNSFKNSTISYSFNIDTLNLTLKIFYYDL